MSSSAQIPLVFDRSLVRARLARALRQVQPDFLFDRAQDDLIDRLAPVQREFRAILDLGSPRPGAAVALAGSRPEAVLTRTTALPEAIGAGPWRGVAADEEICPFGPAVFDLVVSVLALQAANDLPGTLVQVRRSLKPDGLFLAALFGGQTLHELRAVLAEAEEEVSGGVSPRVSPFTDLRDLGHLMQRAGFALPVTDLDRVTVRYASVFSLFQDLRLMGATNVLRERSRLPPTRSFFLRVADLYAKRFGDSDGRIRATFEIVWLSGWSPHESQQKPLRPGSAKVRLADALGVQERGPGDEPH